MYVHSIWRKELKLCYILANDVVSSTVKEVGKQFQQAFMVENTRKEVFKKVGELENRVNGKWSLIFWSLFLELWVCFIVLIT